MTLTDSTFALYIAVTGLEKPCVMGNTLSTLFIIIHNLQLE